jgi:hypothetical protein
MYPSRLFLQALKLSDCLIVSLVKEFLPNVGINNITWSYDLAIRGEEVMVWKKSVVYSMLLASISRERNIQSGLHMKV